MNQKNLTDHKVSVIVPVYNNKSIDICLDSLIEQDYENFEIILIDDGSKPPLASILSNDYKNNKKVNIFSQDHHGVSVARNLGLKKATGDFIMFCDSDDIVSKDWISNMVDKSIDYSLCKYFTNSVSKISWVKSFDECIEWLLNNYLYTSRSVCTKCFRADILKEHNIVFDEDLFCYEDGLFLLNYLLHLKSSSKIKYVNKQLYFYNKNDSGMHTKLNEEQEDLYYKKMKEIIKASSISSKYINLFYTYVENSYYYLKMTRLVRENNSKEVTNIIKNNRKVLNYKNLKSVCRFREKIFVAIGNGKLYCWAYNKFGK